MSKSFSVLGSVTAPTILLLPGSCIQPPCPPLGCPSRTCWQKLRSGPSSSTTPSSLSALMSEVLRQMSTRTMVSGHISALRARRTLLTRVLRTDLRQEHLRAKASSCTVWGSMSKTRPLSFGLEALIVKRVHGTVTLLCRVICLQVHRIERCCR